MADRSTIQHSLRRQDEEETHDPKRLDGKRRVPRVLNQILSSRVKRNARGSRVLYLPLGLRDHKLPRSLSGRRIRGPRMSNMEQEQLYTWPTRLPLEARTVSIRLERRLTSMVRRPKAIHSNRLATPGKERRSPDDETSRLIRLFDPEQHQAGRRSIRQLRWLRDNAHRLRANRPQMLHDGIGPTLLRCNTPALLGLGHWQRRRLARGNEGAIMVRLPEEIVNLKDGPHKRDLIRHFKKMRRKYSD